MWDDVVLPHNTAAERALLAIALASEEALYTLTAELRVDELYADADRAVYRAILTMVARHEPVDEITLLAELERTGTLDDAGGAGYVLSLHGNLIRTLNVRQYIAIVREHARRRQLIAALRDATRQALDQSQSSQDVISGVEQSLLTLAAGPASDLDVSASDAVRAAYEQILYTREHGGEVAGLTYSLPILDRTTTGMRDGELTLIAGYPGAGKSSLAEMIAAANSVAGVPGAYMSLEMDRQMLMQRMLSRLTGIDLRRLRAGHVNDTECEQLREMADVIATWPLLIDDAAGLSVGELLSRARLYVRRNSARYLVVDHVRLVRGTGKDTREQINSVSSAMREFAKTERIPVVLLSQMRKRSSTQGQDAAPTPDDIKETGNLLEDAHVALLLHRPRDRDGHWTGEDQIIIAKQRSGPVGPVSVHYDGPRLTYRERTRETRREGM